MKIKLFMKQKLLFCVLYFVSLPVLFLSAADWGTVLEGAAAREITDDLQYSGTVVPWLSVPFLGANGNEVKGGLYISAGVTAEYKKDTLGYIPELLRTELAYRWDGGEVKAGRIYYTDPFGFVAQGLFDGARLTLNLGGASLGVGAWYTGYLYKKNANITMTGQELVSYNTEPDYDNFPNIYFGDFWDTYFAPRRLLAALDWEHPALAEWIRLKASLIGQMDLSGSESLYHSQYLALKAGIPVHRFIFELGGCFELAEAAERYQIAFAGELGIAWAPPLKIPNRLMLLGRYAGGTVDDTITAFVPITTEFQGDVLKAKFSGLSMVRLEYMIRPHRSFSFGVRNSYFVLNDLGSYQGLPLESEGYFLGDEVYGFLTWNPFSDLQIRGGGGAFLPFLGDADPKGDILWRAELAMSFSVL